MHGIAQDKRILYLYMEIIKGGSLMQVLQNQSAGMSAKMARFYAAQVVECYSYLHENNTIYRDLKPENILVGLDGYIKLADFGFVKQIQKSERTYTCCGTPEYMAPEIIENKGYRESVDWWALGIMLYELMIGAPPYLAQDP